MLTVVAPVTIPPAKTHRCRVLVVFVTHGVGPGAVAAFPVAGGGPRLFCPMGHRDGESGRTGVEYNGAPGTLVDRDMPDFVHEVRARTRLAHHDGNDGVDLTVLSGPGDQLFGRRCGLWGAEQADQRDCQRRTAQRQTSGGGKQQSGQRDNWANWCTTGTPAVSSTVDFASSMESCHLRSAQSACARKTCGATDASPPRMPPEPQVPALRISLAAAIWPSAACTAAPERSRRR